MTPRSRAARGAAPPPRSPAGTDLAALAGWLTDRDRRLCRLVWEHRVLTTTQLARLAFPSISRAQARLLLLARAGVLERFRPLRARGEGSAPWHYVLGPAGAAILAADQGSTVAQLGYRRDRALGIAHSQRLAHQVGVNDVFTALAGAARHAPGAALLLWLSERQCAERWGQVVRPDGYGRWRDPAGAETGFFLEYDTGTEPLDQVTAKLTGYADLAAASGAATPVAFWVAGPGREANLRAAIGHPGILVATAHQGQHPAGPVWLPVGADGPRRRLTALASKPTVPPLG